MFDYCCDLATIVAQRQPLFAAAHPDCANYNFLPAGIACADHRNHHRERIHPSGAQSDSCTVPVPPVLYFQHWHAPYVAHPEPIATFLCDRHFLRAFSSRHDVAAPPRPGDGFARPARTNRIRRHPPETFLAAHGNEARARRSAARMPFASPYCPCLAQIRRLHVQPRTALAVHPSMRVRESCLTFSPPHHRNDSQNPWWSILSREASE